ncbi:serine/threonine-protein kinase [Kibdelosporangium aridum]|uniref:non-specific serine/threonine protein kinase n=1 Tax=Kibdelosporangium aridum TaxID=2030 RepID=A0A1W2EMW2_KIBAR|nr:serine/threonine-protein kinase [Kibdelosporangium aridum]SMD11033.1 Serine/threonine protein kinase [Kibdelosporangium aridum]
MSIQPRTVNGRYQVVRELGRGGMGVVWLAEDLTMGRRVAIKELVPPHGTDPSDRPVLEERVLREARTAGRLSDPGIVTVHDVIQEDGATFIVMELIDAPTLTQVVRQDGPLPAGQVLSIAEQLLSALNTAHAAGVVHRDVKPSNVMIGPNGRVRLTDFGIAQSTEDPKLTQSGVLMGSPTYISPERLRGEQAGPESDLWALGATLFFATEGYGAYERSTAAAAITAVLNERVQVRQAHGPLHDLIMGLLEPDPKVRLSIAQAQRLTEQARRVNPVGEPVVQPTKAIPMRRNSRRGLEIGVTAVVLLAAAALILALTGVFTPDNTANPPAGANPERDVRSYGPDGDVTRDLRAGDCYDGSDLAEHVDDCEQEHDAEIFEHVSYSDLNFYPDFLESDASSACEARLNRLNSDEVLRLHTLVPTRAAWDGAQKEALCVVTKADGGKLTGSVAGN